MEENFGTCPFCGSPLGWDNDEENNEDEELIVRYCHCSNCGADIEAYQCPQEERKNYPYWS